MSQPGARVTLCDMGDMGHTVTYSLCPMGWLDGWYVTVRVCDMAVSQEKRHVTGCGTLCHTVPREREREMSQAGWDTAVSQRDMTSQEVCHRRAGQCGTA